MTNSQILDAINQNIKRNENKEITGVILNSVLRMLLDFVNQGFITFSDIIQLLADSKAVNVIGSINTTTETTSLPSGVYHAQTSGTYTNASNIVVKEGYYTLLRKEGGVWKLESEVEMPMQDLTAINSDITALKNKNGGEVTINETKNVDGGQVFNFVNNSSINKWNLPNFPEGYYKDMLVIVDDAIWESLENNNTDKPSSTSTKWKKANITTEVDQEFIPTSENAQSGVGINAYIGEFNSESNKNFTETDLINITWKNGFYINSSGIESAHENTRYCKISMKKYENVSFIGNVIKLAPANVIVGNGKILNSQVYNTNDVCSLEIIAPYDCVVYFNQNLDFTTISKFKKTTNISSDKGTLIDFLNNKFAISTSENLVKLNLDFTIKGKYFNLKTATVGVTTFNTLDTYSGTDTSLLTRVNAGDIMYVTGNIGNHGLALFDDKVILIEKILWNQNGIDVVSEKIVIPSDGYLLVSQRVASPMTIMISSGSKIITTQELYDLAKTNTSEITTKEYVEISKPNGLITIDVEGVLPTLKTDSNEVVLVFKENDNEILKCKAKVALQGQSSLQYPKKNFTFDLLNANNKKLKLKIGGFIASDSWHIKGFQKDVSMVRDNLTSTLWHKIRKNNVFPYSLIADIPNDISTTASDKVYFEEDARFFADGFPIVLNNNSGFHGLYIFRLKKSRENYKLDNSIKSHIFLEFDYLIDIANGLRLLDWKTFDYKQFELKSPKITLYEIGQPISDTAVMATINNFWSWTNAIYNNASTTNLDQYANIPSFIDYLIACEVSDHWDGFSNNILLIAHNGKIGAFIYDTDHTWGIQNDENWVAKSTKEAFILDQNGRKSPEDKTFWKNFRTKYDTQIKARYTDLRNKGVISIQTIDEIATNFIRVYGYDHFKKEFDKWGYGFTPSVGKASLRQILEFSNASINFLDSKWKI